MAHSKGRSPIVWFALGLFFVIFALMAIVVVEAKGRKSAIDTHVKAFKSWADKHPHTSLLVGIGLLSPAVIVGLLTRLFNQIWRLPEIMMLPVLGLCLLWFPAAYLITKSLYISIKRGGRSATIAAMAAGTGLILTGGGVFVVLVLRVETLLKSLEGSLILYGPIPIPGVLLIFIVLGLGLLLISGGIMVFAETLRRKTKKPQFRR